MSLVYTSVFAPVPYCFYYYGSVGYLDSVMVIPQFSLPRIVCHLGSPVAPEEFGIVFLLCEELDGDFDRDSMEYMSCFW